jgi:hypothetical protein
VFIVYPEYANCTEEITGFESVTVLENSIPARLTGKQL